jgi:hypothetical protein
MSNAGSVLWFRAGDVASRKCPSRLRAKGDPVKIGATREADRQVQQGDPSQQTQGQPQSVTSPPKDASELVGSRLPLQADPKELSDPRRQIEGGRIKQFRIWYDVAHAENRRRSIRAACPLVCRSHFATPRDLSELP